MKTKTNPAQAVQRFFIALFLIMTLVGSQAQPVFAALPAPTLERGLLAAFTDCASQSQIPEAECGALVALYNAAGGASWSNNSGWLASDTPCDDWYGVGCAANHVTRLTLNNNNLVGSLPAALGDLTALQVLNLNHNQLSGAIPPELGSLTALQTLNLSNNSFSAAIPAELGSLPSLAQLLLAGNALSGAIPPELGSLTTLQALNLSANQLTGTIPTQLGSLENLLMLSLSTNSLEGTIPVELGGLTNLTTLSLDNNQLTGAIPAQLGSLSNLKVLELYGNQLSGAIPSALGSLSNLEQLIIGHNLLSGSPPVELKNLSKMWHLSLVDNALSGPVPEAYDELTSLTVFRFYSTSLCEPTSSQFQNWKDTFASPKIWLGTASCYGKTSPTDALTGQPTSLALTWDAMTPAVSYQYCVDETNDNACSAPWVNAGLNTTASISGLQLGHTYYWQVRAKDKVTNPRYIEPDNGAWWSFTVMEAPLEGFAKTGPGSGAINVSRSPTLTWTAADDAVTYEYCGSTTSAACPGDVWTSVGGGTHADLSGLLPNTTYYWQVRVTNSHSQTIYADDGTWWQFTTVQEAPSAFGKTSPVDAATNVSRDPTLTWQASSPGVTYEYCGSTSAGTCPGNNWISVGDKTSVDLSELSYSTLYYWQVRARNSQGDLTYANSAAWWSFTTTSVPPPAAFAKSSPADYATGQATNPTLSWGASDAGVTYEYCVSASDDNCASSSWHDAGEELSVSLSGLDYNATYYWQARAVNSGGATYADGGTWRRFTTRLAPPTAFAKTSPADNAAAVPINPTLSWAASDAGVTYEYCVSISGAACPGNNWFSAGDNTSVDLSGLSYSTLYYWQVRAVNSQNDLTYADGGTWRRFTTAKLKMYLPIISAIAP